MHPSASCPCSFHKKRSRLPRCWRHVKRCVAGSRWPRSRRDRSMGRSMEGRMMTSIEWPWLYIIVTIVLSNSPCFCVWFCWLTFILLIGLDVISISIVDHTHIITQSHIAYMRTDGVREREKGRPVQLPRSVRMARPRSIQWQRRQRGGETVPGESCRWRPWLSHLAGREWRDHGNGWSIQLLPSRRWLCWVLCGAWAGLPGICGRCSRWDGWLSWSWTTQSHRVLYCTFFFFYHHPLYPPAGLNRRPQPLRVTPAASNDTSGWRRWRNRLWSSDWSAWLLRSSTTGGGWSPWVPWAVRSRWSRWFRIRWRCSNARELGHAKAGNGYFTARKRWVCYPSILNMLRISTVSLPADYGGRFSKF